MSKISGGITKRELDRRTWSQIERLQHEVVMRGSGEYLMDEPIYFGRAYSTPPAFSYSAAARDAAVSGKVMPQIFVPPKEAVKHGVDGQGVSASSMTTNSWVQDPGFEVQGQWIGEVTDAHVIPGVHYEDDDAQIIWKNYAFTSYAPREPFYMNRWVQSNDSNARWIVSSDKPHDLGLGYAGKYSAKYTFGSDSSSNWLIPFQVTDWGHKPIWGGYDMYMWWSVNTWPTFDLSYAKDGIIYSEPPPYFAGWDGFCYVWSDSDCELETYCYEWDESDSPFEDEYPEWDPTLETGIRVRNIDNQKFQLVANSWNRVEYYFPMTNSKSFSYPYQPWTVPGDATDYNPGECFWTWRYRINNGSPGQVVYFDNAYVLLDA